MRIEFDSDDDLRAGVHEIFANNLPFEMMPIGHFDLSEEVLNKLREKGIAFHEIKVIPICGLSKSDIAKIKKENKHVVFTRSRNPYKNPR